MQDFSWYKGKKVLVTGHTGFKGSWLCRMLTGLGAEVTGYSLEAPTEPSLFEISGLDGRMKSVIGDIRDYDHLLQVFTETKPEIVLHLAAQPIVRESYREPRYTYETNVMGTVNLLECVRLTPSVRSVLNVTTDKVYLNEEREAGYKEDEKLDGFDPYSNSKSCSELVTHSYKNSFFTPELKSGDRYITVSTARAGNVIGGGDFAPDRIIPDSIRAVSCGNRLQVRNPYSVRPYQHVLEPLAIYLTIAMKQYDDPSFQNYYNVGPDDCDCVNTGALADLFCRSWGDGMGWDNRAETGAPHEAGYLRLNCDRIKRVFGWKPTWHIEEGIIKTIEFSKVYLAGGDVPQEMDRQINEFFTSMKF
ncbi:MAG: CDP-glucose 4,6-dehydratase [Saccharofermentans sp.]|jgi:CDP-glucose 4,6-dehydratase|nr:CDP-glucose 4,6-dehydratase [Mageeibacillus sp.]MCI1263492.1 CDP-glucose 4,6-dehydratase [Saccharofermentans sp.]MCI1275431.1 CDP-glucose 4,6-dehydratase [Saccharofermentans sp.]MCI2044170.1 CDP-glucose 4,6-dehydratase [Mageeibacillus sp.]